MKFQSLKLKKFTASLFLVCIITLMVGCQKQTPKNDSDVATKSTVNNSQTVSSDISSEESTFSIEADFTEKDIYALMFNNNVRPYMFDYDNSFVYKYKDKTYVTLSADSFWGYGIYEFSKDGTKKYIADDGWCCYVNNDVLYYLEESGHEIQNESGEREDVLTRRLMTYKNNTKTVFLDEVDYFCYSGSGIYYTLYSENAIFKINYDGSGKKQIFKATSRITSLLEYDGFLWVTIDGNIYKLSAEGEKIEVLPYETDYFKVRNHYLYFYDVKDSQNKTFMRYNTLNGKTEKLPYIQSIDYFNFTDDYILSINESGSDLIRADKSFEIKKIFNAGNVLAINVVDNEIYIVETVESDDGTALDIVKMIDANGNVKMQFDSGK